MLYFHFDEFSVEETENILLDLKQQDEGKFVNKTIFTDKVLYYINCIKLYDGIARLSDMDLIKELSDYRLVAMKLC